MVVILVQVLDKLSGSFVLRGTTLDKIFGLTDPELHGTILENMYFLMVRSLKQLLKIGLLINIQRSFKQDQCYYLMDNFHKTQKISTQMS